MSQASHCGSSRPAPSGNAINPPPGNNAAKPRIRLSWRGELGTDPSDQRGKDFLLLFMEQRAFCLHLTLSGVIFRSTPALAGVVRIIYKSTDLQRHCPSTKREEILCCLSQGTFALGLGLIRVYCSRWGIPIKALQLLKGPKSS